MSPIDIKNKIISKYRKYLLLVVIVTSSILLLAISFISYNLIDNYIVKSVKNKASYYATILENYKIKKGMYPSKLDEIVENSKIGKSYNGSEHIRVNILWTVRTIRYDLISKNEYEFTISECGGISIFNSRVRKWEWHD